MRTALLRTILLGALAGALGCPSTEGPHLSGASARRAAFFAPAAQTISLSPELNAALGAPMTLGDPVVKSEGEVVTLQIPVSGPRGSGRATIHVARKEPSGIWVSRGGDFIPASGPPIHLAAR